MRILMQEEKPPIFLAWFAATWNLSIETLMEEIEQVVMEK